MACLFGIESTYKVTDIQLPLSLHLIRTLGIIANNQCQSVSLVMRGQYNARHLLHFR